MGLRQRLAHAPRRATNVSLNETIVAIAQSLEINISQAAENGIERAIAEKQIELWLLENKAAMESANAYVTKHGLPLTAHRQF
jgi:antitoxin CcdA